ncbi:unnamed protein product [Somion occarium]|uniref:RNA polymerase II subunit A C-terminal domain phosphatase n=1 Tax=Somion occarium TaxID=3059160 RepID=A0ABP1CIW2_9APHY
MSDPTPTNLHLPLNLPYPITIVAHAAQPADKIQRGTRLLSYSFTHLSPNSLPEVRYGTWDSTIEGTLDKWNFQPGDHISRRKAHEVPAVLVSEPCKHDIQMAGLCCQCGKDMTIYDYTGFSDASRASIQMTHLANGPTVSLEEAQRIERETAQYLLKSRKLSLIVDLDQTIVHATVDPTVGEWISEGEAWEARQVKKSAESTQNGDASSDGTISDEEDEVNPNWEALKDVKKFRLGPEALGQADPRGLRRRGKDKCVEQDGCMYYIKPRPGWQEFLTKMAAKYEMHVYTMGTRAYAEEVCTAIDPEGKIFGGRILSRDESGSLTQKSLQRLFPSDQSMVVIIDDRADVWEWSPNLVKVIPYDFFVGIGDINSAFLPKLEPLTPMLSPPEPISPSPPAPISPEDAESPEVAEDVETDVISTSENVVVAINTPSEQEDEEDAIRKSEILIRNHQALDAQVEERPLAKKQEALLEEAAAATSPPSGLGINGNGSHPPVNGEDSNLPAAAATAGPSPKKEKVVRKALLKNDDTELTRVQEILEEVHRQFYESYDAREEERKTSQKHTKRKEHGHVPYDTIIPQMRMRTFQGVHILFSSVIPLDTRPESTEIWRTAEAFGATCYTELNKRITHVVAAKRGTVKVDAARRQGGIKIVWLAWFTDSIAFWRRQDETPYLMDPEPINVTAGPASPYSPPDAHQISSDPEPDADDWDEDGRAGPDKEGLALDEVDWEDINNEVEAAMNESDDEGMSERSGIRSANGSDDESMTDESNSVVSSTTSTPRRTRKRLRSITPSDGGLRSDVLRSPLAKRKKVAAERSGASRLKETFSAGDLTVDGPTDEDRKTSSKVTTPRDDAIDECGEEEGGEEEEEEEETDGVIDDDDDFLARELGQDWG